MAKKESAKRGYMTRAEIEEHLKGIGTTSAKIAYLGDMVGMPGSRRKDSKKWGPRKLVSEKTRKEIYSILGELYEKKEDYKAAEKVYQYVDQEKEYKSRIKNHLQKAKFLDEALTVAEKERDFAPLGSRWDVLAEYVEAARVYEHLLKDKENALKLYNKVIKLAGNHGYAANLKVEVEKRKKRMQSGPLESKASMAVSIAGIVAGLFFLSPVVTGSAIGAIGSTASSGIGVALMVLGALGLYFCKCK